MTKHFLFPFCDALQLSFAEQNYLPLKLLLFIFFPDPPYEVTLSAEEYHQWTKINKSMPQIITFVRMSPSPRLLLPHTQVPHSTCLNLFPALPRLWTISSPSPSFFTASHFRNLLLFPMTPVISEIAYILCRPVLWLTFCA